jgi:D-psicose/D-tagatose/L-ribulose 3-epimerase
MTKIAIGICSSNGSEAAKYKFDYVELPAGEIAAMSEYQFSQYCSYMLNLMIPCRALNKFIINPELKIVGLNVQSDELRRYTERCMSRCHRLGASIIVWGSASSRNVPQNFSRKRAWEQIAEFLLMAGEVGRSEGITLAIEPLRRKESNILNTGWEALQLVKMVNHPNIRMLIDYYHMRHENEDPGILIAAEEQIVHLHFATFNRRLWPRDAGEDDHYALFFKYLKQTGYSGGISIEGRGAWEEDAAASLAFFRQMLG